MFFYIAVLVTSLACSVITIKTLVGYSDMRTIYKYVVAAVVLSGWFAPLYIGFISKFSNFNAILFDIISFVGYSLFGFVFILFMLLLLRDLVWYIFFGLAKAAGHGSWSINPKNISLLDHANLIVATLSALLTVWAVYAGSKVPAIKEINLYSPLVKRNWVIVQLSDLHITRATPLWRVNKVVDEINSYYPDMVFMTGDIIDDRMPYITRQIDLLGRLSPSKGVWSVMGNHEFYNGLNAWDYKFQELGFNRLFNRGELIKNTNIFVAGVPDLTTAQSHPTFNINFIKALEGSHKDNYKVLLSHNPQVVDSLTHNNINLQLSGHTHGGQIFPFHWLAAKANTYLAGLYKVNGIDLYISRGAGTWGPSMRLFAPSEITVITIHPVNK